MKPRFFIFLFLLLGVVLVSGCGVTGNAVKEGTKITVYKSPTCSCCEGYISELKRNNFDVNVEVTQNIVSIKDKYGVLPRLESCHTSIINVGDKEYFIEGHVPLQAVHKLLEEKPDIEGIALSGMPTGSPGMPGLKTEKFRIFSINKGESSMFMEV